MTIMPSRLPRLLVLSVLLSMLALGAHAAVDTQNATARTAAHVGGADLAIFVSDDPRPRARNSVSEAEATERNGSANG